MVAGDLGEVSLHVLDRNFQPTTDPVTLPDTMALPRAVAIDDDGRILVLATSEEPGADRLRARLYTPDGTQLGDEITVSIPGADPVLCAEAIWTSAGWLVTWRRSPLSGNPGELLARRLTP